MKLRTPLILVLMLALVGATVLAWRQWVELVALRAASPAEDERAGWQARLDELKKRNLQLQTELARARLATGGASDAAERRAAEAKTVDSSTAKAAEAALLAGGAAAKNDNDLELISALANLPEFQRLLALQQGGRIDEKYAALFKKLHLSPEELARFQSLLGAKQSAVSDIALAVREQGLTGQAARDVARQLLTQSQQTLNNSIKDLLGAQRFNQFQTYERTAPQRETVDQLAQRLSYTSTPLTPKQSDQLVQVLAARPPVNPANPAAAQPVPVPRPLPPSLSSLGLVSNNYAPILPSAVATASTFLTGPQLTALARMQQEQQAQQILGNLIRTGSTNPPATPALVAPVVVKPKG